MFFSLCNICCQNGTGPSLLNISELKLDDIDSDIAIIIFRSLTKPLCGIISGDAVGHQLETMLANNNTLLELILLFIDEAVVIGLADGLPKNRSLSKLTLKYIDEAVITRSADGHGLPKNKSVSNLFSSTVSPINRHALAKLLYSMDGTNIGLLELKIIEVPLIHRATTGSMWYMTIHRLWSSYVLFPHFICTLCEICNGHVSPGSNTAKSVLASCPIVDLSRFDLDTTTAISIFVSMTSNTTIAILDLSYNDGLVRDGSEELCKAIETMLVNNNTLKQLNLSGVLNDITAMGLVAGLQENQTLKQLEVDANILKMQTISSLLKLLDTCGLVTLAVTDIFIMIKCRDSRWLIKVLDQVVWPHFLSILKSTSPEMELLNALKIHTNIQCLYYSPVFDAPCKTLDFTLTVDDKKPCLINRVEEHYCNTYPSQGNFYEAVEHYYDPSPSGPVVRKVLTDIKSLKILKLSGCALSDGACKEIVIGLAAATQLKKLNLSHA